MQRASSQGNVVVVCWCKILHFFIGCFRTSDFDRPEVLKWTFYALARRPGIEFLCINAHLFDPNKWGHNTINLSIHSMIHLLG